MSKLNNIRLRNSSAHRRERQDRITTPFVPLC